MGISIPPGWLGSSKILNSFLSVQASVKEQMLWGYLKMATFPLPLREGRDFSYFFTMRTWRGSSRLNLQKCMGFSTAGSAGDFLSQTSAHSILAISQLPFKHSHLMLVTAVGPQWLCSESLDLPASSFPVSDLNSLMALRVVDFQFVSFFFFFLGGQQ